MATLRNNDLVEGLSGSIGGLVFRQYNGKTILSCKGQAPRKQSEQQRENRNKFKSASLYAKRMMLDADKKAYYWHKAKKLKLPNAYTAAICDYMRKGQIKEIDTRQYNGKAGNVIRIKAHKKDFAIHKVRVTLSYADGSVIETDDALKKDNDHFIYKLSQDHQQNTPIRIQVVLDDHRMNRTIVEKVL